MKRQIDGTRTTTCRSSTSAEWCAGCADPDFSCPIAGYGPESLTCDLAGLTVPPEGLRSVKLTITLGSWWGGLDQYGSVPFSSAP